MRPVKPGRLDVLLRSDAKGLKKGVAQRPRTDAADFDELGYGHRFIRPILDRLDCAPKRFASTSRHRTLLDGAAGICRVEQCSYKLPLDRFLEARAGNRSRDGSCCCNKVGEHSAQHALPGTWAFDDVRPRREHLEEVCLAPVRQYGKPLLGNGNGVDVKPWIRDAVKIAVRAEEHHARPRMVSSAPSNFHPVVGRDSNRSETGRRSAVLFDAAVHRALRNENRSAPDVRENRVNRAAFKLPEVQIPTLYGLGEEVRVPQPNLHGEVSHGA